MYHVKLAITKVKERKETTTTEPGSDAKIPDVWRVSALLDFPRKLENTCC